MHHYNFDHFFYPKSIAIVGASNNINKIGGFLFSQIKDRKDLKPIPINMREEHIQGHKTFPTVKSIGESVDLVVIAIPAAYVLQVIEECTQAKCKNIVIISAGFKEVGEEGKHREEQLKNYIIQHNLNVIGPNCLGILNPELKLNCSFAKEVPQYGKVALISQSGAVIDAIIDWSFKHNVGFSKIVSMGNMAGIDELAMLHYLKDDPKTRAIVFYMETLEKGRLFGEVLKEVSKKKPVIIIKPGTSENAKKAIGSHTGSLAQDNTLVKTLIEENNGILVEDLNQLFNMFIAIKAEMPQGEKTIIVTNAGGPGVIATDSLAKTRFELTHLTQKQKDLFTFLPKEASVNNPIDILGDGKSDRYLPTIQTLESLEGVDNIMVLLTPQIMTDCYDIAKALVDHKITSKKTLFSSFLGDKEIGSALKYFDMNNFPNFQTPTEGLHAMNSLLKYAQFDYEDRAPHYHFNQEKVHEVRTMLSHKTGMLDYNTTKKVLSILGIQMPHKVILKTPQDLLRAKLYDKRKYILKVDANDIVHKKDIGGVVFGITQQNAKEEIEKMFTKMSKHSQDFTLTLEEQVKGSETIIGLKNDPELGPFIMFGMGGTYVNVVKDIHFATAPLSRKRAKLLVEESKVYTILKGYRGSKPIDFKHLYELLIRISFLQELFPEIAEVDLNPVICNEHGIYLVDVKLIVRH